MQHNLDPDDRELPHLHKAKDWSLGTQFCKSANVPTSHKPYLFPRITNHLWEVNYVIEKRKTQSQILYIPSLYLYFPTSIWHQRTNPAMNALRPASNPVHPQCRATQYKGQCVSASPAFEPNCAEIKWCMLT